MNQAKKAFKVALVCLAVIWIANNVGPVNRLVATRPTGPVVP